MDTMRQYLACYEKLRDNEKRLIADGFNDKLLSRGKIYGKLIKIFATRSQAAEFRRRPSLHDPKTTSIMNTSSPKMITKKVPLRSKET